LTKILLPFRVRICYGMEDVLATELIIFLHLARVCFLDSSQ